MRRWRVVQQMLKGCVLVALILVSCSAPGGDNPAEGCGGIEAMITCLEVVSIMPTSDVTDDSSNVDAFRDTCRNDVTGEVTGVEPFTDHNATVTLQSQRFPTATGAFDIRVVGYSVAYRLNQCPLFARGCPPLPGFTVTGTNMFIPAGQSITVTLPFVPLRVKDAYVRAGGELGIAAPSYTTVYTFTAQTVRLNDTFTVEGSAEFTITNFDNCN